jgi:hypothetical protein
MSYCTFEMDIHLEHGSLITINQQHDDYPTCIRELLKTSESFVENRVII